MNVSQDLVGNLCQDSETVITSFLERGRLIIWLLSTCIQHRVQPFFDSVSIFVTGNCSPNYRANMESSADACCVHEKFAEEKSVGFPGLRSPAVAEWMQHMQHAERDRTDERLSTEYRVLPMHWTV